MESFENRVEKIESELLTSDEWIGADLGFVKGRTRKQKLKYIKDAMYKAEHYKHIEPFITTDLENPEGVPDFVLELERDVHE